MSALGSTYFQTIRREPLLVCYWRLNDLAAATLAPDVGLRFGVNGVYLGSPDPAGSFALIQGDASAGSALFAGTTQSIQVPDAAALRVGLTSASRPGMAIEAMVVATSATQSKVIASKGSSTFAANPYSLSLSAGAPRFAVGNGTTQVAVTSPSVIPVGSPTHVVGVMAYSISATTVSLFLYVNGVLVATQALGAQAATDAAQALYIGASQVAGGNIAANIAEVAVYSGSLSARRVARHYQLAQQVSPDQARYYSTVDPPVVSS